MSESGRARSSPLRVLFVCTGNICRSPLAEAVFRRQVEAAGRSAEFEVDSAGTHGYHVGEAADPRARRVGRRHGLEVTSIAREVERGDFERFDLILALDRGHLRQLRSLCPAPSLRDRIRLLRDFGEPPGGDVPDPYYSGEPAFEEVYQLLEGCCRGLLAELSR